MPGVRHEGPRFLEPKNGPYPLQLEPADYTDVVAIPHPAISDRHSMRKRVGIGKLNLLDHFACFRIVFEKGIEIGVCYPEVFAFPTNAVRPVACSIELRLHHPGLRIYAINTA